MLDSVNIQQKKRLMKTTHQFEELTVAEWVANYTLGDRFTLGMVWLEIKEFLVEILYLNPRGAREEFQDTVNVFQVWLFWRFGFNGKLWLISRGSVEKFMARKTVWQKLYKEVGLRETISNYTGNFNRREKVCRHLAIFGVNETLADWAWRKVVVNGVWMGPRNMV